MHLTSTMPTIFVYIGGRARAMIIMAIHPSKRMQLADSRVGRELATPWCLHPPPPLCTAYTWREINSSLSLLNRHSTPACAQPCGLVPAVSINTAVPWHCCGGCHMIAYNWYDRKGGLSHRSFHPPWRLSLAAPLVRCCRWSTAPTRFQEFCTQDCITYYCTTYIHLLYKIVMAS